MQYVSNVAAMLRQMPKHCCNRQFSGRVLDVKELKRPCCVQIFSKDAFPAVKNYFRYMHFTSEAEAEMDGTTIKVKRGKTGKRVLRFSFALPPADKVCQVA